MIIRLIDTLDRNNVVYLIPLGDLHLGSPNIDIEKFQGYIDWIKKTEGAYTFIMGDMFDVATLQSPTKAFGQVMNLNEGMKYLHDLLYPIKDKIIGAITGNHEERLERFAGFNPLQAFCDSFGITYCGYSAILRFKVGHMTRNKLNIVSPRLGYVFYAHHTTGGGATLGGKLNRVKKLSDIFEGADAYLGGHNHSKAIGEDDIAHLRISGNGNAQIEYRRIVYVDTGSFLTYDNSYAEEKMLPPSNTGAPRLRMNGVKKDLHVSY
jgi:hypothetical protein